MDYEMNERPEVREKAQRLRQAVGQMEAELGLLRTWLDEAETEEEREERAELVREYARNTEEARAALEYAAELRARKWETFWRRH